MKRVSFKVAQAIKDAGFPQDYKNAEDVYTNLNGGMWVKPTYIEAWLWLWREKDIKYEIVKSGDKVLCKEEPYKFFYMKDPEEAIEKAIEYLVTNNLIK